MSETTYEIPISHESAGTLLAVAISVRKEGILRAISRRAAGDRTSDEDQIRYIVKEIVFVARTSPRPATIADGLRLIAAEITETARSLGAPLTFDDALGFVAEMVTTEALKTRDQDAPS